MKSRTIFVLAVFLAALGLLAGSALAQVDPKLNPPGPPGPTMKTLDQITPTWDQVLPAAERFKLVMPTAANPAGEAVLDKETGLVWEQMPGVNICPGCSPRYATWSSAQDYCYGQVIGSRFGWRLPTLDELLTLRDPSGTSSNRLLPAGHPFTLPPGSRFWSSTTDPSNPANAYAAGFCDGNLACLISSGGGSCTCGPSGCVCDVGISSSTAASFPKTTASTAGPDVWCVRGGQGASGK